jgi:predicted AAA+ superfamily ATPase
MLKYRFLSQVLPSSSRRRIVLITGARQTGKTTLARKQYSNLRYINLDAPENRELLREISSDRWSTDIGDAIIDEAQKEPVVFDKIKYAYDEKNIHFEVILGSSQILLIKKIRESLAGRVSLYELWPLMMSEIYWNQNRTNINRPLVDKLFSEKSLDEIFQKVPGRLVGREHSERKQAEKYLLDWGGMPALLPLSDDERIKWLKDYEYTYLERDLADFSRLDDLVPFRKFQKLSALRSGQLLNYSEIARDASFSVDTAKRYLEYLKISYQVILLQPYHKNLTSSIVKTPKLYWLDIGLLRQLSGHWGEVSGSIYETMVIGELIKWMNTIQSDVEIYFYRTRSGLELDILIQTTSGIIGIEIKNRNRIVSSDMTSMKKIATVLGQAWKGGLVIYKGDTIEKMDDLNIWAVPSCRLFI